MARWFGSGLRTTMAEEVAKAMFGPKSQKAFYNEANVDIRLASPGVRWDDIKQLRRAAFENFKESCQESFDQIYQQIIEGNR